jgi:hypothetical protein
MKPRTCRHCRTSIPLYEGYKFDGFNLICENCDNIAFEVNNSNQESNKPKDTTCETLDQKYYSIKK